MKRLIILIALIIFVIFYSKKASGGITRSIEDVYDAAEKLESGDYNIETGRGETLELDRLEEAMSSLSKELADKERLEREEEEKRMLLVSELSHDLKNPLAGVQGYSEMLLNGNVDEAKTQDYLKIIHDNSLRANKILQSLFTYSKVGSAGYKPEMEETDISEFTREIAAEYIPRFEDGGFTYRFDIPEEEIKLMMNKELFRRVYDNLLENSIKYNQAGTEIYLSVRGCRTEFWRTAP